MTPELLLVALSVAAVLCVGLTIVAIMGWRADTDHDIEILQLRCLRLERQIRRLLEAREGDV